MRVLVTGAGGFTGTWMMAFLASQLGVTPFGLVRRNIPQRSVKPDAFLTADLLDRDSLQRAIKTSRPDAVIHLAGLTSGTPEAHYATNVTGTKILLNEVIDLNPDCRILVISSSAVYGYAGDLPIPETTPLRPVSEYGRSKVAQETLALQYLQEGTGVCIARPFNLAGPGLSESLVCGKIVRQVIEIEQQRRTSIDLLEITSSRDLVDVRDVVRGYWALISRADFSVDCAGRAFNLGSGNAYAISTIISLLEEITGVRYPVQLAKIPPSITVPTQKSDNSRITSLTGWKPEITLKETLRDMLTAEQGKKK